MKNLKNITLFYFESLILFNIMWLDTITNIKNTSKMNIKQKILDDYFRSVEDVENDVLFNIFDISYNYKFNSFLSNIDLLVKIGDKIGEPIKLEIKESFSKYLNDILSSCLSNDSSEKLFLLICNKIRSERILKDEYVDLICKLSTYSTKEQFDIYIKSITKKLTIGANLKTINKSLKNNGKKLIDEYECMKCSNFKDASIDPINSYVSIKKDGVNCTFVNGKFYTRTGKELWLPHIKSDIYKFIPSHYGSSYVMCGELVSSDRIDTSRLVTSSMTLGEESEFDIFKLKLYLFDMIDIEEYESKVFKTPFSERYRNLEYISKNLDKSDNIKFLKCDIVNSEKEVFEKFEQAQKIGEEGIIWNDKNGLFEFKRSKKRTRLKVEEDADLKIIGYEIHSKNKNWIGSLKVSSECGKLKSDVGSGLTEELREKLYVDIDKYIGKIVSVKYNDIIENSSKDGYSLFLPIFKEIKIDKLKADLLSDLMSEKMDS